jgi:hypothetical protein
MDAANRISRMEQELLDAWNAVFVLAPVEFRELLRSYSECETREDSRVWQDKVVEAILETAARPLFDSGLDRMKCPLCQCGTRADEGFSIPVGIQRHLTGWAQQMQCDVMKAVHHAAKDYWHDAFREDLTVAKRRVEAA